MATIREKLTRIDRVGCRHTDIAAVVVVVVAVVVVAVEINIAVRPKVMYKKVGRLRRSSLWGYIRQRDARGVIYAYITPTPTVCPGGLRGSPLFGNVWGYIRQQGARGSSTLTLHLHLHLPYVQGG